MGVAPKQGCHSQRFDALALPPGAFVTTPVKLAVMEAAEWDSKSVADLAA